MSSAFHAEDVLCFDLTNKMATFVKLVAVEQ